MGWVQLSIHSPLTHIYPFDLGLTGDPDRERDELCIQSWGWVGGGDQFLPILIILYINIF